VLTKINKYYCYICRKPFDMTYENYFYNTWENIDPYEISTELYNQNEDSFNELTYELHRIHRMSGLLPPNVAARVIVLTSKFKLQ
jgi:hypothetical protein